MELKLRTPIKDVSLYLFVFTCQVPKHVQRYFLPTKDKRKKL